MEIQPLDIAAVAIIAAATLRGLFIGLIREGFSLASLGGAYLAVQIFTPPTAEWLQESTRAATSASASLPGSRERVSRSAP